MAGYPPSYPPPPGTPYGYDARAQRRLVRDQMRARERELKRAAVLQAAAYRQQASLYRRSSILGPVLVVAFGVAVLVTRWRGIPFEQALLGYSRWWPLVLVVAGLLLVAEWAFDQRTASAGQPQMRRGLGGGAVFLILLLALTGVSAEGFRQGHDFLSRAVFNGDTLDEFMGEKHERTQQLDLAYPAGTSLAVDNPHGDVTITGRSADDQVHVTVDKQVYSFSDADADTKATQASARLDRSGDTLTLSVPSIAGAVTNLTVTVPETAATTVTAGRGAIRIDAMHAPVTVTSNRGDVELNSIAGTVTTHINNRGSSFSAHSVDGSVTVEGNANDLTLADVSGKVSLTGDFYGDTHLERLRGPVEFATSRTQFSLARVDGEVDMSPGSELSGSDLVGPVRLRTRSRDVNFDRTAGDVSIVDSNGSVEVTSADPLGNVSVDNNNGSVTVTLPEHAGLAIDAQTRGGAIDNQFGLASTSDHDRTSLTGKVGSGAARIDLRTTHADIDVNRAAIAPAPPPAAPATTPPPAHKAATKPGANVGATRAVPLTPEPVQP